MERRKNPPAFIRNTYDILEREDLNSIIAWSLDGSGFIIHDLVRFEAQILPQYFKHKKFTSFVRQLNMYGFHKQRHNNSENYFQHETFRKGDMLSEIRRKPEKKKKGNGEDQKLESGEESMKKQIEMGHSIFVKQEYENEGDFVLQENNSDIEIPQNILSLCDYVMLQNRLLREMRPVLCEKVLAVKKERKKELKWSIWKQVDEQGCSRENVQKMDEFCRFMKENTMKISELTGMQ